jgi:transcriptional regulator with XRE-family HTH domain
MADRRPTQFGALLREWRARRSVSQLTLAVNADVSQRHLSFIESGRARPSREMVARIGEALDVPLRGRNEMLAAAGFASLYPERSLVRAEMARARGALERILSHHEPHPAMVVDRAWNIVLRNRASARIISACIAPEAMADLMVDGELNFMRVMFWPSGMRPHVLSWQRTANYLIGRLRREATSDPGSPSAQLLHELRPLAPPPPQPAFDDPAPPPTAPLELEVDGHQVRLFNTLATFGTPQDVTLQELRIEMSFPMDEASEQFLRDMAAVPA